LYHDELRAGTRTELGRKWSPVGHRPVSPIRIGYENIYLYLSLCPFTGQGYAAFLPKLNAEWFGWFVRQIQACLGCKSLFIADGAKAHKADLFDKAKLTFKKLPPYCPELNPVERIFKEVRRQLKHRVFSSLDEAKTRLKSILETLFDGSGKVISLSCFPYIKNASLLI
jgi:hypothetical protein